MLSSGPSTSTIVYYVYKRNLGATFIRNAMASYDCTAKYSSYVVTSIMEGVQNTDEGLGLGYQLGGTPRLHHNGYADRRVVVASFPLCSYLQAFKQANTVR